MNAFVGFRMRSQVDPTVSRKAAHLIEIGFESIEIEDQTRGRQIMDFFHAPECITQNSSNFVDFKVRSARR